MAVDEHTNMMAPAVEALEDLVAEHGHWADSWTCCCRFGRGSLMQMCICP